MALIIFMIIFFWTIAIIAGRKKKHRFRNTKIKLGLGAIILAVLQRQRNN